MNDKVTLGKRLAIQRNAFGEVVAEYTSPVNGLIGSLRSDATSEPAMCRCSSWPHVSGAPPYSE